MPRSLRIEYPGALYHVLSRGVEGSVIVRDNQDRRKRLQLLQQAVERWGWQLHAFVLMRNHDHLFVETPESNLSVGMQAFNGQYAAYFNRRYKRSGHLFQGRFKSHIIEKEGYFLAVSRYIHLNPVRAGLVELPEQYPWSSYRGYHRRRYMLQWMRYDRVLSEFGEDERMARSGYCRFVHAGLKERLSPLWSVADQGMIIGSDAFLERVQARLGRRSDSRDALEMRSSRARPSLDRIISEVGLRFGRPDGWSVGRRSSDDGRAVAAYLSRQRFGYSGSEVAKALGYRSSSSVSHAIARIDSSSSDVKAVVENLEARLAFPLGL